MLSVNQSQSDETLSSLNSSGAARSGYADFFKQSLSNRRRLLVWLAFLALPLLFLLGEPAPRIGDGSEYYIMAIALANQGTPYATPETWIDYEELREDKPEINQVPSKDIISAFERLRKGDQQDFPHFWLYPAGAAIAYKIFSPLGLSLPGAFMLFHGLLAATTALVLFRRFGPAGIGAFLLLWLFSPLLWYSDKVHTEFYTFCLGILAFAFVIQAKPLVSAVMFSLMAAQNPLFGLPAVVCLAWFLWLNLKRPVTYRSLILIALALGLLALHPLYYLFRFGVLTPQFITGAAGGFVGWEAALVPLVDPNIGLLWGWPLGAFILSVSLFAAWKQKGMASFRAAPAVAIGLIWVLLSLYSHGSTVHQNHGAVIAVSRYATWYIPLFFPVTILVIKNAWGMRNAFVIAAGAIVLAWFSVVQNWPSKPEFNDRPTVMGDFVMRTFPSLYDPYPQIFIERYMRTAWGTFPSFMLHPSSGKLLWYSWTGNYSEIATKDGMLPTAAVAEAVQSLPEYSLGDSGQTFQYYHLSDEQVERLVNATGDVRLQEIHLGEASADHLLSKGWHASEKVHRWSTENAVLLVEGQPVAAAVLAATQFQASAEVTNTASGVSTETHFDGEWSTRLIPLDIGGAGNSEATGFQISVDGAWSPAEVYGSLDKRILGLSVRNLYLFYPEEP